MAADLKYFAIPGVEEQIKSIMQKSLDEERRHEAETGEDSRKLAGDLVGDDIGAQTIPS